MGAGDGPIGTVYLSHPCPGVAGDVPVFTTIPPIFSAEPEELEDLASTAKHVLVLGLSHGGYKDSVARTIFLNPAPLPR
jgi:hypothetical protein